ncbi:MAG: hypothetical protein AAF962_14920 [Actinomycetota bacterium]
MSEEFDYEDLTGLQLDEDELSELLDGVGECVFNWTTSEGYPVGVVVAYFHDRGKFWTTCAATRKRVPALRKRPQSAIVINTDGKTATYKGDSIVHAHGEEGFAELSGWFYDRLSRLDVDPDDEYRKSFRKFLDSPERVIIETDARLVVGFSAHKFRDRTMKAMAEGLGAN